VKHMSIRILLAVPVLFLAACNLEDGGSSDPVFTCDASATVAEMCIQEPASLLTQEASKSTCLSAKGSWSDTKTCPSGSTKKCADGSKTNYYYAKSDGSKSCSELVGLLDDNYAGLLFPSMLSP
jgi:hypothetical protein